MTRLSKGLYDRLIHEDELAEINKLIFEGRATVKTPSYIAIPSPKITRLLHEFYRFLRPGKCYRQLKNPQHSCPVNL